MKSVIRNYLNMYRAGRNKIDTGSGAGLVGAYTIAIVIAVPMFVSMDGTGNILWKNMPAVSALILFPMAISCFGGALRRPELDKMLYLCPMSRRERKKYIYGAYCFGVGFNMLFAVIGICMVIPISCCDVFSAVQILLNDFLLAIMIAAGRKEKERSSSKEILMQMFLAASAFISNIIEMIMVLDKDSNILPKAGMLAFFCVIQLPMAVKYGRYVKGELDHAVYYS